MREFFVGILVIMLMGVLSVAGILLFPLLLVLGLFLRLILGFLFILVGIWLVGKVTLLLIDAVKKHE